MAEYYVRVADSDVCDFCSDPLPKYLEPCGDFTIAGGGRPGQRGFDVLEKSRGSWKSCQTCHDLIAAARWRQLEERAVDSIRRKRMGLPRDMIAQGVRLMHASFREHRP